MKIVAATFSLPKRGHSEREYEDAAWPPFSLSGEFNELRIAVADGAAEASFSRLWAKLLVQSYRRGCFKHGHLSDALAPLRHRWLKRVKKPDLPWYIEQKLDDGAFASLTGLTLTANGHWKSTSVGDCCLIHYRRSVTMARGRRVQVQYHLLASSPMTSAAEFNSRPVLLSTSPRSNDVVVSNTVTAHGEWHPGDGFYLMSDALACWFFKQLEQHPTLPFETFRKLRSQEEFVSFAELQRQTLHEDGMPWLKNDDVTLIKCSVTNGVPKGLRT